MAKLILQINESCNIRYDIMGLTSEQMTVIRNVLKHAWGHAADPEDKTFNANNGREAEKILKTVNDFDEMYANPIKV